MGCLNISGMRLLPFIQLFLVKPHYQKNIVQQCSICQSHSNLLKFHCESNSVLLELHSIPLNSHEMSMKFNPSPIKPTNITGSLGGPTFLDCPQVPNCVGHGEILSEPPATPRASAAVGRMGETYGYICGVSQNKQLWPWPFISYNML